MQPANTSSPSIAPWLILCGAALFLWALLILGVQCLGWLKHAVWQEVPVWALLVAPDAQTLGLRLYGGEPNALSFVPALGSSAGPKEVARWFAGDFAGVQVAVEWFLNQSLVASMWIGATAVMMLGASLDS